LALRQLPYPKTAWLILTILQKTANKAIFSGKNTSCLSCCIFLAPILAPKKKPYLPKQGSQADSLK
jgi:hypothetical protein